MFYPYRKEQKNHSLFDGILDLSPGDKARCELAATQ